MDLLNTSQIRAAVQEIAQRAEEKTADRLRAYNLLYAWCRGTDEAMPESTEELLDLLRRNGGLKVRVEMQDDDPEDEALDVSEPGLEWPPDDDGIW